MLRDDRRKWDGLICELLNVLRKGSSISRGIIHETARCGLTKDLSRLITTYNVNLPDKDHRTALHYAAYYGRAEDCKCLIDIGAMILADCNERTPLHLALMSAEPRLEVVQQLVGSLKFSCSNYWRELNRQ